ncbi:MAG: polysaccharide deacetylase family protein, partial [Chloroflexi bacterium]|nr:polysaccharide deacetylase family protein [Chloroflexota bacterium]
ADMFERQLDALQAAGFVTTTMEAVADALDGVAPLPAKSVVLTFDDGDLDNCQVGYRALLRRGMTGTFFIVTGLLGGAEHMNWDQVKEMAAGGMEMQAHGKQHLDMSRMSATALRDQLAGSRAELERRLGLPVRIFAYPAGRYSADTIAALKAAGYRAALTTRLGSEHHTSDRYELRRMRVHGADTFAAFAGKLRP